MDIKASEVESVKTIGELNGQPVKLVKTIGGFWAAMGARSKSSKSLSAIAAGSHPALVAHQIHKEFKSDFKESLTKSEHEAMPVVKEHTHKLPHEMVQKGYNLYSLTKNNDINFVATKLGAELINMAGIVTSGVVSDLSKVTSLAPTKETAKICAAIAEVING